MFSLAAFRQWLVERYLQARNKFGEPFGEGRPDKTCALGTRDNVRQRKVATVTSVLQPGMGL
jgi:hypothetical protein